MAAARIRPLVHHLRHLAGPVPDAELLQRFARGRDEAAFELLLRRHGPMVFGVCRRLLGDRHTAEDCFQAVFLVLARQAGSLRRPEALGAWLYGVALRTARKARTREARRRQCERRTALSAAIEPPDDLAWRDLRPVLDEAIALLPKKYRTPFALHHLEGLTVAEVARQLGCPPGTVAARLARARDQLRRRLTRQGLAPAAGALAAALSENAGAARVPAPLVLSTITAAAAGAVPAEVAALAQGVLKTMTRTRLKAAAAVVLVVAVLSGSAAWLARPLPAAPPDSKLATLPRKKPQEGESLQGEWTILSEILEGKDVAEASSASTLVFSGDVLTFRDNHKDSCKAGFDLCPRTRPARIDVVFPKESWTLLGIYRREGNLLIICLATPGTRRPTAFESRPGSHLILYVLKRRSPTASNGGPTFGVASNSDAGVSGSIGQKSRASLVGFVDAGTVYHAGSRFRFWTPEYGPIPMALDFGFPVRQEKEKGFSFWMGFFR